MRIEDNQSTAAFRQEAHHLGALALAVGGRRVPFGRVLACPEQPHGKKNVWDRHPLGVRWLRRKIRPRVDGMAIAVRVDIRFRARDGGAHWDSWRISAFSGGW